MLTHILSFPIHERLSLAVHLEDHLGNGQRIYFNPNDLKNQIQDLRNTTLMASSKLYQEDNFARTLLYDDEVPLNSYNYFEEFEST